MEETITHWGNISDWVLAALTGILAMLTYFLASEARKTRLHNVAPHLIVTLDVGVGNV